MRYGEIRSLEVPTDRTEARWMKAPDELKFRTINASNVFDSASLIVDGHVMNLMREIVLASESFKGQQVFVVKHTNLGLQAIMKTIHLQRSAQVRRNS